MQIFSKRKRNDRFFFLNATSFGTTIGDLWEIYGLSVAFYKCASIIMLQKSSARMGFCAEGWGFLSGMWNIKHAEVAIL